MPRFAANLSMIFTEVPFPRRFEAAARAGFTAVELLFPYDFPADDIARWLADNDPQNVLYEYLFNLMDELHYAGWIGCEYRPAGRTEDGLGWFNPWRQGRHFS